MFRAPNGRWYSHDEGEVSPRDKRITVSSQEQYDGDWPPEDAAGFIGWFQAKLDSIPPEFRDAARIKLDSNSGYEDSHYVEIEITYMRPETAEEVAGRVAEYRAQIQQAEAQQRAAYEALKAKYG